MAGVGEALTCAATPPRLVSRVLAPTVEPRPLGHPLPLTQRFCERTALALPQVSTHHHWLRGAAPGGKTTGGSRHSPRELASMRRTGRTTGLTEGSRAHQNPQNDERRRAGARRLASFSSRAGLAAERLRLDDHQVILAVFALAEREQHFHQQPVGRALVGDDDGFR